MLFRSNSVILEDLYRGGGIRQGNISLDKLGTMMKGKRDAVRRSPGDIDTLGDIGRELQLRARWETAGHGALKGEDILHQALGTGADIASTAGMLRSRPARAVQRYYAGKGPASVAERASGVAAAGQATRPFQSENE